MPRKQVTKAVEQPKFKPITMKLPIKRSRWYRGQGSLNSSLLTEDGTMCCLGFLAKACGLTDDDIYEKRTVVTLMCPIPDQMQFLINSKEEISSFAGGSMMNINDDISMSPALREQRLTKWFAKYGIEVEFVD